MSGYQVATVERLDRPSAYYLGKVMLYAPQGVTAWRNVPYR